MRVMFDEGTYGRLPFQEAEIEDLCTTRQCVGVMAVAEARQVLWVDISYLLM